MIRSMTGFGRAVEKSPYGDITVEIKTLNHKSLSVNCTPFNGFFLLEEKVKKSVEKQIHRGKVFIKISREGGGRKKALYEVQVNEDVAGEYLKRLRKMAKKLGIPDDMSLSDLAALPGVIEAGAEKSSEKKLWPYIRKALKNALEALVCFREKEGKRLEKDFSARLKVISRNVTSIGRFEKQCVANFRKDLVETIKEVVGSEEPDKSRLEAEVAAFARNCDIAEEITRLGGHVESFFEAMEKVRTDAGKKLDFIAQEMQREANTIAAKSGDFRIAKAVIEVKSEIEKIREQIRNVE